jgi:hypothetical protein
MRHSFILGAAALFAAGVLGPALAAQPTGPTFAPPVLITSVGQSGDAPIAAMLFKKAEIAATYEKLATEKNLDGPKTIVLVLGASMKGLGAAGLDAVKENARVAGLIAEARKKGVEILCLHVGGEARRGELTDEMVRTYLPAAKAAIVVKSGNKDGLFSKLCQDKGIPLIEVEKTLDAIEPLKKLFSK